MSQFLKTLAKSQLSAFIGGVIDYLTMLFFTEVVGIHYVYSIWIGGAVGAVVNYSINRLWTFEKTGESITRQLPKFVVVVIGTIFLKSAGTFFLTEFVGIDYKLSRPMADIVVALGFNFMLQRFWVFKSSDKA